MLVRSDGLHRNRKVMSQLALELSRIAVAKRGTYGRSLISRVSRGVETQWHSARKSTEKASRILRKTLCHKSPMGDSTAGTYCRLFSAHRGRKKGLRALRKEAQFKQFRNWVGSHCFQNLIGGTRLDTFLCDTWWPMWAALSKESHTVQPIWFNWYPGDISERVNVLFQSLKTKDPKLIRCNGWNQAILKYLLESEGS